LGGRILYNPKAKQSLANFYNRKDTLSLGVCNGCQLMMELGLVYPEWKDHPRMNHNGSEKFESTFVNVTIPSNNSVLLSSMAGARLGVWVAHGEGKFKLPADKSLFQVAAKFSYGEYPGNPNDSDYDVAGTLFERRKASGYYASPGKIAFSLELAVLSSDRKADEISPWMEPFVNAKAWIKKHFQNV
jgi:phosphoribosylformylglycinamidine synthase